jgi:hypothetical protein
VGSIHLLAGIKKLQVNQIYKKIAHKGFFHQSGVEGDNPIMLEVGIQCIQCGFYCNGELFASAPPFLFFIMVSTFMIL